MLEFLIDSIFFSFGGILFQQIVGIPMGTNCSPLLAEKNQSFDGGYLRERS
jgi:hypothetical protein